MKTKQQIDNDVNEIIKNVDFQFTLDFPLHLTYIDLIRGLAEMKQKLEEYIFELIKDK